MFRRCLQDNTSHMFALLLYPDLKFCPKKNMETWRYFKCACPHIKQHTMQISPQFKQNTDNQSSSVYHKQQVIIKREITVDQPQFSSLCTVNCFFSLSSHLAQNTVCLSSKDHNTEVLQISFQMMSITVVQF